MCLRAYTHACVRVLEHAWCWMKKMLVTSNQMKKMLVTLITLHHCTSTPCPKAGTECCKRSCQLVIGARGRCLLDLGFHLMIKRLDPRRPALKGICCFVSSILQGRTSLVERLSNRRSLSTQALTGLIKNIIAN